MEFIKQYLDALELDFVGWRYVAGTVSIGVVLLSWIVFAAVGPNWGIDFTGGTEIHLRFEDPVEIGEIRQALAVLELSNDAVQEMGGSSVSEFAIRIQDPEFGMEDLVDEVEGKLVAAFGEDWIKDELKVSAEVGARFTADYNGPDVPPHEVQLALQGVEGVAVQSGREENQVVITVPGLLHRIQERIEEAIGERKFEVLSIDAVGPKVGGELRRQGFISIAATLGLVLLYVAFRFDIGFAPGAVAALIHDVSVTVGIFVLLQLEFNLPMIGALLTIVGYSLNDTIVIYDRIRENRDRYRRKDLAGLINVSISETLTRTVATSVTTLLAITMFLLLGGPVIRNFALAMALGIIFGTYSTMFVATPMIIIMEEVKPYLNRFVAAPEQDDDDFAEGDDDRAMTASEKRRRERADAEKRSHDV